MKKLFLFLLCNLAFTVIKAQDNIVIHASKKTTFQQTPKQIIDSLKKRFPNADSVQYYKTSKLAAKNGWNVTETDNMDSSDNIDMYTLSFKRADFNYYALFSADGKLLKSKYEEYGKSLPDSVKTSLRKLGGSNYKDYYIQSEIYYKTVNQKDKKSYYEIIARSKKDSKLKKTITLNESGKVLKVK